MTRAISETFARMRHAQLRDPFADWATRARRLRTLSALVHDHRDAFAAAIASDFGRRPLEETGLLEIFPSIAGLRHALRHGRRWMRTRRQWAGFWFLPARTEIRPQPAGVVGIIVPWNYPLYLAIGPMTDAIVAGNRVMVKMSELTPRFSALFAEVVGATFPSDEIAVINGDAAVAREFSALPFDHLLFTGSTAIGREVMRSASANLTPVTLELGGKSPAIIGPSARFEHAVERIMLGKLLNAGQTCIAPDYVLLPRSQVQRFVEAARAVTARLYPAFDANHQYASIASARHFSRLSMLRDGAVAAGAIAHGLTGTPSDSESRIFEPTLLSNLNDAMEVMQEEIFGPLLPLLPYDSLDEALDYVKTHAHPLALYAFDDDTATIERILRATQAGGVSVNDTILHIAQHHLPFGGVGSSGMGAYHGEAGFRTFSRMKPVFRQSRFNLTGLLNPPYRDLFRRMMGVLLGR